MGKLFVIIINTKNYTITNYPGEIYKNILNYLNSCEKLVKIKELSEMITKFQEASDHLKNSNWESLFGNGRI